MDLAAVSCGPYLSNQSILIVGDGNFSFSLSIARTFPSGRNMIVSSFDSMDDLYTKYPESKDIVTELRTLGATVSHDVDATNLQDTNFDAKLFDRIVFQFPLIHAKKTKEEYQADPDDVISNRRLLRNFLRSAAPLLTPAGEIHITSKDVHPYKEWHITDLVCNLQPLYYLKEFEFDPSHFPGYVSRNVERGGAFPLTGGTTYVFGCLKEAPPVKERDMARFPFACDVCKVFVTSEKDLNNHSQSRGHGRKKRIEEKWAKELLTLQGLRVQDHYKILGISRNATDSDIKKAFFDLAKKWHPDRNKATGAKQKFVEISEAYETLMDKTKRQQFDLSQQPQQTYRSGNSGGNPFAGRQTPHEYSHYADPRERGFNSFAEEYAKYAEKTERMDPNQHQTRQSTWSKTILERDQFGNIRIRTVGGGGDTQHQANWQSSSKYEETLRRHRGPENPWTRIFEAMAGGNRETILVRPTILDWPSVFEVKQVQLTKKSSEFQVRSIRSFLGTISEKFISPQKGSQFTYQQPSASISKARFWIGMDGKQRGVVEDLDSVRIVSIEESDYPPQSLLGSIMPRFYHKYLMFGPKNEPVGTIYTWDFLLHGIIFSDEKSRRIGTASGGFNLVSSSGYNVQLTAESILDASVFLFFVAWKVSGKQQRSVE